MRSYHEAENLATQSCNMCDRDITISRLLENYKYLSIDTCRFPATVKQEPDLLSTGDWSTNDPPTYVRPMSVRMQEALAELKL